MADIHLNSEQDFFQTNKAALEKLETIRHEKLATYERRKKTGIPAALATAAIAGCIDYFVLWKNLEFFGLTPFALFMLFAWVKAPVGEYKQAYKTQILPRIAKLFGDLTFSTTAKITMDEMSPSRIVPGHDIYRSGDYFSGEYHGINLEFSEISLIDEYRDKDGKRQERTVFRGLAVLLNTKHKRFYGHTILTRNTNKIAEWFKEKSSGLERAEMVDPEFEDLFDAYTNDQVEARYLIDPVMIERLKQLHDEFEGKGMSAAFYENKMLILIKSHYNHFEPGDIYTEAINEDQILRLKHEIGKMLSIIDKLNLYDPEAVHKRHSN